MIDRKRSEYEIIGELFLRVTRAETDRDTFMRQLDELGEENDALRVERDALRTAMLNLGDILHERNTFKDILQEIRLFDLRSDEGSDWKEIANRIDEALDG